MINKFKDFILYIINTIFPIEYIIDVIVNWNIVNSPTETKQIIFIEKSKVFLFVTVKSLLFIFLVGLTFENLIKPISITVFDSLSFPKWMLPICLYISNNIYNKIIEELAP